MTNGWALTLAILTCWFIHRCARTVTAYLDPDLPSPTRGDRWLEHVFFLFTGRAAPVTSGDLDLMSEGDLDLEPDEKLTESEDEIILWVYRMFDLGCPNAAIETAGCSKFQVTRHVMKHLIKTAEERSQ